MDDCEVFLLVGISEFIRCVLQHKTLQLSGAQRVDVERLLLHSKVTPQDDPLEHCVGQTYDFTVSGSRPVLAIKITTFEEINKSV